MPDCAGTQWTYIMDKVRDHFFLVEPADSCGSGFTITVTVITAVCFEMHKCSTCSVANCIYCPGAYCAKTCELCFNPLTGLNVESSCTFSQIGNPDCSSVENWTSTTVGDVDGWDSTKLDHCFLWSACE